MGTEIYVLDFDFMGGVIGICVKLRVSVST